MRTIWATWTLRLLELAMASPQHKWILRLKAYRTRFLQKRYSRLKRAEPISWVKSLKQSLLQDQTLNPMHRALNSSIYLAIALGRLLDLVVRLFRKSSAKPQQLLILRKLTIRELLAFMPIIPKTAMPPLNGFAA